MDYTIIKSKKQYQKYCVKVMNLASKKPTKEIEDEMELIELLIDTWERENLKNEDVDPIQLIKFLMENHNIERGQMIEILDIKKGTLSKILSYKKGLSKNVIRKLAEHFKMAQEAFNRPYPIISEANKGHKDEKMMNFAKELEVA